MGSQWRTGDHSDHPSVAVDGRFAWPNKGFNAQDAKAQRNQKKEKKPKTLSR
jgi:hypothetical protein